MFEQADGATLTCKLAQWLQKQTEACTLLMLTECEHFKQLQQSTQQLPNTHAQCTYLANLAQCCCSRHIHCLKNQSYMRNHTCVQSVPSSLMPNKSSVNMRNAYTVSWIVKHGCALTLTTFSVAVSYAHAVSRQVLNVKSQSHLDRALTLVM